MRKFPMLVKKWDTQVSEGVPPGEHPCSSTKMVMPPGPASEQRPEGVENLPGRSNDGMHLPVQQAPDLMKEHGVLIFGCKK